MARREEGNLRPGRKSAFAQERKCATTPSMPRIKTPITSAYLKHSNFLTLNQRIVSPIAVHMKPDCGSAEGSGGQ